MCRPIFWYCIWIALDFFHSLAHNALDNDTTSDYVHCGLSCHLHRCWRTCCSALTLSIDWIHMIICFCYFKGILLENTKAYVYSITSVEYHALCEKATEITKPQTRIIKICYDNCCPYRCSPPPLFATFLLINDVQLKHETFSIVLYTFNFW